MRTLMSNRGSTTATLNADRRTRIRISSYDINVTLLFLVVPLRQRSRGEFAPLPDLPPVLVKHKRDGCQETGDASDQGRSGAHVEGVEHVLREQRRRGPARGPTDGVGRHGARGVHEVGVGEVVEVGDKDQHDGSGQEGPGQGGHDPMDAVVLAGPTEPKHGDGEPNAADHGDGETVFGGARHAGEHLLLVAG